MIGKNNNDNKCINYGKIHRYNNNWAWKKILFIRMVLSNRTKETFVDKNNVCWKTDRQFVDGNRISLCQINRFLDARAILCLTCFFLSSLLEPFAY